MPDFHRTNVNDGNFIRGAARLLVAPYGTAFPTQIDQMIYLASTSANAQYDPRYVSSASGWVDLGATKTGVQITINNGEESFDIDQQLGDIASQPTNWECSVGTQLAEFSPEKMQLAWEGGAITVNGASEKQISFGTPASYTQRRLAVLFQRPNGKIRAYVFRKVQRMPQESSVTHAKTGEQISIPMRFRALPDNYTNSSLTDRFFTLYDQDTTG